MNAQEKIELLDMASCPDQFNKSSFLACKRELKAVLRGEAKSTSNDYPQELRYFNSMLNYVDKRMEIESSLQNSDDPLIQRMRERNKSNG